MENKLQKLEIEGLVAAIQAADANGQGCKCNIDRHKKIGSGLVTVMVRGDVGAVEASVDANVAVAKTQVSCSWYM